MLSNRTTFFASSIAIVFYLGGLTEAVSFGSYWICGAVLVFISLLSSAVIFKHLVEGRINVYNLLAYATLLAYAAPLAQAYFLNNDLIRNSVEDYFWAMLDILCLCLPVQIIGLSNKRDFLVSDYLPTDPDRMMIWRAFSVSVTLCILEIGLLLSKQWTYGVFIVVGGQEVPPLVLLAAQITTGLSGLSGLMAGKLSRNLRTRSGSQHLLFLFFCVVVLLQISWWLPIGRRFVIVQMVLAVLAFIGARNDFILSRARIVRTVFVLILLSPLAVLLGRVFIALRMLSWMRSGERADLLEMISQLNNIDDGAVGAYEQNAGIRALIISSYTIVKPYVTDPFWGRELLSQVVSSIPSALIPKIGILDAIGGANESLWSNLAGVPLTDYAQTLLLEGYLDFWLFGFLVYAFVINFFFRFVSSVGFRLGGATFALLFAYGFFYVSLQVEQVISSVLGYFRSMVALAVLVGAINLFLCFKSWRERRPIRVKNKNL